MQDIQEQPKNMGTKISIWGISNSLQITFIQVSDLMIFSCFIQSSRFGLFGKVKYGVHTKKEEHSKCLEQNSN
jgi:hypothetical protein